MRRLLTTLALVMLATGWACAQAPYNLVLPANPTNLNTCVIKSNANGLGGPVYGLNYAGGGFYTNDATTHQSSWTDTSSTPGSLTVTLYQNSLAASVGTSVTISGCEADRACLNGTYSLTAADNTVVTGPPARGYAYTLTPPAGCTPEWFEEFNSAPAMAAAGSTFSLIYHFHCCAATIEQGIDGELLERTSADGATWSLPAVAVASPIADCPVGDSCSPQNPVAYGFPNGDVVVLFGLYKLLPAPASWLGTWRVKKTGGVWGAPAQVTALPAANPTARVITSSGGIHDVAGGCIGTILWDANANTNKNYLYTSCDGGLTWGAGGGSIASLTDNTTAFIALPNGSNEQTFYWIPGTTKYIGFGRGCNPSNGCGGNQLKYFWSSTGASDSWSIGTTTMAAAANHISPLLLPGSSSTATLVWGERVDGVNMKMHALNFDPVASFGDATQFSGYETLWKIGFNASGYPAIAVIGPRVALAGDGQVYAGGTRHLYVSSASYACGGQSMCMIGVTVK